MNSPSDNDNNKDAASDAKASGGEPKADKFASAKETLNKTINKTRVLAGKAFAAAKATTKDVVQELRNVNSIRKETVATAAEGTKKTELAKTFWTKTSGKQRGIVLGISALILYAAFSIFSSSDLEKANTEWNNKNYIQAYNLYKKLAEKGLARAQYDLGYMYSQGQAVIQSDAQAMRWWKLAAAQGSAEALTSLGYLYMQMGTTDGIVEAKRVLLLSASLPAHTRASADAQRWLGVMDQRVNDYQALMWLNLAISYKNKDGKDIVETAQKIREEILSRMNSQQIAEAQKLAKECQSRNYKNCDSIKTTSLSSTNVKTQKQTSQQSEFQKVFFNYCKKEPEFDGANCTCIAKRVDEDLTEKEKKIFLQPGAYATADYASGGISEKGRALEWRAIGIKLLLATRECK
jgi:TPR repeat protein